MCYYVSNDLTKKEMKDTFGVNFDDSSFKGSEFTNGFEYPKTALIIDEDPAEALLGTWGLIPFWSKNRDIRKNTLNARIETLSEKKSFKEVMSNRCLMPVKGFYEWKWLDARGKQKEKYFIRLDNGGEPFALGGIYSLWQDPKSGEQLLTFSVVTSNANELMSEIHNTKDRMPLVLTKESQKVWLQNAAPENFFFPQYDPPLLATNLEGPSAVQLSLF